MSADTSECTRLTVNLTDRNAQALKDAAELTGLSKTDTVNRALAIYRAIVAGVADGTEAFWYEDVDGRQVRLVLPAGQGSSAIGLAAIAAVTILGAVLGGLTAALVATFI